MLTYISRRIMQSILGLLIVSVVVFSILYLLPGDPVELMVAEVGAKKETMDQLRQELGLNDPVYVQYGRFLFKAVQGDFGRSIKDRRPVLSQIASQIPATVELAVAGLGIAVLLGTVAGTLAAVFHRTWADNIVMAVAVTGVSMPAFWLGLLLMFFFSLQLGWVPATGTGGWSRLVLPAFTLGFTGLGTIARLSRSSVLEVIRAEYIVTARAKGLPERVVIIRHALRNALIPVVTVVGLQFGHLLGGAVVVETVFARQGVGSLLLSAVMFKDFPMVQGTVLMAAVGYAVVNLLVDISYALIDPRIRYGESTR